MTYKVLSGMLSLCTTTTTTCNICSVDNDAADDKLSDKSADSGDEVEHPKYSVSSREHSRFLSHPVYYCTYSVT